MASVDPFKVEFKDPPWLNKHYGRFKTKARAFIDIKNAIMEEKKDIVIDKASLDGETIRQIAIDVMFNYPLTYDLLSIDSYIKGRKTFVHLEYERFVSRNEITDRVNYLYDKMKISKCTTDLEIEYVVNEWLVSHCKWDDTVGYRTAHSVIGILMNGRGVCSSFALTTSLLLNCFGVKCYTVHGKVGDKEKYVGGSMLDCDRLKKSLIAPLTDRRIDCCMDEGDNKNETHLWNYVKLNGKGRHLDVTFNAGNKSKPWKVSKHNYFNLTTEEILAERTILFGPDRRGEA